MFDSVNYVIFTNLLSEVIAGLINRVQLFLPHFQPFHRFRCSRGIALLS